MYFLNQSVPPLIGADRVWSELSIPGKGVTVAVIGSGIDATHPDLPFGEKVIQNVKIAPDLFGLGRSWWRGWPTPIRPAATVPTSLRSPSAPAPRSLANTVATSSLS